MDTLWHGLGLGLGDTPLGWVHYLTTMVRNLIKYRELDPDFN
jgi:hypothetical protein